MSKIVFFLIINFLLLSCGGGLKDAGKVLRGDKIYTTDEFLVKKKDPLILPPGHKEVPEPKSLSKEKKENGEEKIKKILNSKTQKKNLKINLQKLKTQYWKKFASGQ